MNVVARCSSYVHRLMTHPVGELSRAQRFLRGVIDLTTHCARTLREDRAGEMAAALTYRTIFSLVPLVVLSMLAFRMFGDMDVAYQRLQTTMQGFFDYEVKGGKPEAEQFKLELDQQIKTVTEKVASISFESIGAVGAVLLVWAGLGLLITVEQSANTIFRAPTGRPWASRIMIYWAVVTLGPLLLFASLYMANQSFAATAELPVLGPIFQWLRRFSTLGSSWLLLMLLYKLMPNTHVRMQSAMIGAAVAAGLWELSKWGFGLYVSRTVPYSKLYGTLGLIPLFLYWLYVNWMIILFGLELTYALQSLRGRRLEDIEAALPPASLSNPQWIIPIMSAVARAFDQGKNVDRQDLAAELQLPSRVVAEIAHRLGAEGLIFEARKPGSDLVGIALARSPDRITLASLLEIGRRLTLGEAPRTGEGWGFLSSLYDRGTSHVGERTLASLVRDTPPATPAAAEAAPVQAAP